MYLTVTNQTIVLGVTAQKLPASPLVGRKYIAIQNIGNVTVFLGNTMVTADTAGTGGFQLLPKGTWREEFTHNVEPWGVIASGSSEVYIEEGK